MGISSDTFTTNILEDVSGSFMADAEGTRTTSEASMNARATAFVSENHMIDVFLIKAKAECLLYCNN